MGGTQRPFFELLVAHGYTTILLHFHCIFCILSGCCYLGYIGRTKKDHHFRISLSASLTPAASISSADQPGFHAGHWLPQMKNRKEWEPPSPHQPPQDPAQFRWYSKLCLVFQRLKNNKKRSLRGRLSHRLRAECPEFSVRTSIDWAIFSSVIAKAF